MADSATVATAANASAANASAVNASAANATTASTATVATAEPTASTAPTDENKIVKRRFNNGWTREIEIMVEDWSDRAQCFRWMHDKTSRSFHIKNQYLMIPVIILSTLTGTANFGLDSLFQDPAHKRIATLGIGGVSILTGIISTLANFLRYAQGSEAHSGSAIAWGKFSRFLNIEMALHPNDRMEAFAFLKMFRIELDRLIEQSPQIPEAIIANFKQVFRSNTEIKRPDITGYIEHTHAFDNKNERLKQLAVEAALTLASKKRFLKEIVLEDLEKRVRTIVVEEHAAVAATAAATAATAAAARPSYPYISAPAPTIHSPPTGGGGLFVDRSKVRRGGGTPVAVTTVTATATAGASATHVPGVVATNDIVIDVDEPIHRDASPAK